MGGGGGEGVFFSFLFLLLFSFGLRISVHRITQNRPLVAAADTGQAVCLPRLHGQGEDSVSVFTSTLHRCCTTVWVPR